jgi:hypothetical protein
MPNLRYIRASFCADIDNLGAKIELIRRQLKTDPHVQAFFTSPSGTGLKVLFRVEPDGNTHRRSFYAVEKHVRDIYNVRIDQACKDVSRLCYVCYDPDIFIRKEEAVLLEPLPEESAEPEEFVRRSPCHARIASIYGEACLRIGKALVLNEKYFVRRFQAEHQLLYDQTEGRILLLQGLRWSVAQESLRCLPQNGPRGF